MAETRVRREAVAGATAWRKTYDEGRPRRRVAALRWLARRLGANALLPPAPLDAEGACRTERAMIRRLAALGARVPQVLEAGPRELLLSDLGPTLASQCRAEPDAGRRERMLWCALEAIMRLHARGGYLNQAFARNITLDAGGVGFIDLEEDPCTAMPLAAAQARDLLLFAHSTARFLADRPHAHARMLAWALGREPGAVCAEVAVVAGRLRWLAPLARPAGRRAAHVALALDSLRAACALRDGTDAGAVPCRIISPLCSQERQWTSRLPSSSRAKARSGSACSPSSRHGTRR